MDSSVQVAAAAAVTWPSGGFQWTDELRAQLPVVRGVNVPAWVQPFAMPDAFLPIPEVKPAWRGKDFPALAGALKRDWTWWGDGNVTVTRAMLDKPDREAWLQLFAQLSLSASSRDALTKATTAAIVLHGISFALELALDLGVAQMRFPPHMHTWEWMLDPLRQAVACASELDHDAARSVVERRGRDAPAIQLGCAYVFPHLTEWAEACMTLKLDFLGSTLQNCVLSVDGFLALCQNRYVGADTGVLLQIHLHEERVMSILSCLLERSMAHKGQPAEVLALLARMQLPQTLHVLASHIGHADVRRAVDAFSSQFPVATLVSVLPQAHACGDRIVQRWARRFALRGRADLQAALPLLEPDVRAPFDQTLKQLASADAAKGALPAALRDPLPSRGRLPKLPHFYVCAAFRRPQLNTGGTLDLDALDRLGSLLAIAKGQVTPELQAVRAACTRASLAAFAWDLFEAWLDEGASTKEGWAFGALGLFGDDEVARRLATLIRAWPGESANARAMVGLDVLASIGTDVALMHLHGIAIKVRYKPLQQRAQEKIAAVAAARGLTSEELADRLVPDLGLHNDGTLVLDFGPRHFSIGFDETLKPFVRDAQGVRLKDLPKPIKSDDEALAIAAADRYKLLKKDAKDIARLQLVRLEQSMVDQRRWRADGFRLLFLEHPLMRHLVLRLVWGVYEGEALQSVFRVAEDRSFADAQDQAWTLPGDAIVGIPHVLELDPPTRAAFSQLFANYEIQAPFLQLERETYVLTSAEQAATRVMRFKDREVATGGVMGLLDRGWRRGEAESGSVNFFLRPLPGGLQARLRIDPGYSVMEPGDEPSQLLPELTLQEHGADFDEGLVPFARLHPIAASELLRDLDTLDLAQA